MKLQPLFLRFITRPFVGWQPAAWLLALSLATHGAPSQTGPASTRQAPPTRQVLHGHIPAAASTRQSVGRLPASQHLHLAIGLPLRNQQALGDLLQQIYDPASPNFHHYLTPEDFAAAFGPSPQDYQAVVDFAKARGLTITGTHPNRTLLDVEATVAEIEAAFHVRMQLYQHPKENRTFYAPDTEPSVDLSVPLLAINGLNNYMLPRPLIRRSPGGRSSGKQSFVGSGPGGNYMGYDFRKAYVPGVTLTGLGQTVALFEADGYFPGDISAYVSQAGLPSVPLQNILLDGFDGTPGPGNVEVALDIEMAICMAPGLSQIIVYEGPFDTSAIDLDLLNRIATDNLAAQISSSWLIDDTPQYAQIYKQFAVQGQSFFQASGDECAYYPGIFQSEDSPLVTLVGGTTLSTTASGAYSSERVWNWGGGTGSGGGISTLYPIPSYQQGISMSANQGSTTKRNVPDVALTADNIFVIADNGTPEEGVGGTSAAAPLWAAFTALVNQQGHANCNPPVGFLNPAIYSIGKGPSYTNDFHDVTLGNNESPNSPKKFSAVPGYDLCTGWGSPNGITLINAFAPASSVSPASGSALIGSTNQSVFVTIPGVTNGVVTATIAGVTNLTFRNDGKPPDLVSNDFTYSASFQVPAAPASLTMALTATAPGIVTITNTFFYSVIAAPLNDYFTNATKVPALGAAYLANNSFATIETNEPPHDGDSAAAGSLWWVWTPTTNTAVLIDATGSRVDTVLAAYTGTSLTNLQQVAAAASNLGQHQPAFLTFNAQAFQAYYIALAGIDANSLGSFRLAVVPGGQPDTTPPALVVTSGPQSGLTVTNQLTVLSGVASDPPPNPTAPNQVRVTVNGKCGPTVVSVAGTTNWTALASLQPGLNVIQLTAIDEAGNSSSPTTIELNYFLLDPANDFFASRIALTGASGSSSVSTANATKEVGEPDHASNSGGKSAWWSFQTNVDGVLTLSTLNSTFDTLLAVYTGTVVSNLTPVTGNDDAYPGAPGGFSQIGQAVRSNQTYSIAVDGFAGASGTAVLTYSFAPATVFRITAAASGAGTVQLATTNSLGGSLIVPGSVADVASNSAVMLTPIPSPFYQFNGWGGDIVSQIAPLTVVVSSNLNVTAAFGPIAFTDGFESGNLSQLNWTTAGDAPWFVQTNVVAAGRYAARSGVIGNNQTSSLLLTTNFGPGTGSFYLRVSSEPNFDLLSFSMDGFLQQQWSGETGWEGYSFSIPAGTHTLQWTYSKDPTISQGLDAAFIDNLVLPIPAPVTSDSAARLALQQQTDGSFSVILVGQTNQTYILQSSSNLVNWQNISTNFASNGYLLLPDPSSAARPVTFYRAVAPY